MEIGIYENLIRAARDEGIQQLVVGAVIPNDDAVLLLKRPASDFMGGIWELPSGKVETGETLAAAVTREVYEETGLKVVHVSEYLGSFDYKSGSGRNSRQFNFLVAIAGPISIKLSEHETYMWSPGTQDAPVTDAVDAVIERYRAVLKPKPTT